MELLSLLVCGVKGAESGTVEIRRRGTATFAQLFTDYDGSGAVTPTAGVALDSNGGVVRYVNEAVDCVVKSSTGNVVRTFTHMQASPALEVRSQSFTGVDYGTGLSAASSPTTAQVIFDAWKTSAGAVDFKVLLTPSNTVSTLKDAFSSFARTFYNVTAPKYGAVGDGVTNDRSAIQAAIDDANLDGGGIVFFPAGIYRVTTALSVSSGVTLLGVGQIGSTITVDHASNGALTVAGNTSFVTTIRGLRIQAAQSNSGSLVSVSASTKVLLDDCYIGHSNVTGNAVLTAGAATLVTCVGTTFEVGAAAALHINVPNTVSGRFVLMGCRFVYPATYTGSGALLNGGGLVLGCTFDGSTKSAGVGYSVSFGAGAGGNVVAGCTWIVPTGGTLQTVVWAAQAGWFFANHVPDSAFMVQSYPQAPVAANASFEGAESSQRATRYQYMASDAAAVTVNPESYGTTEVKRATNGNQTINAAGNPPAPGLLFTLVFNNNQGAGSGTITMGTGFKGRTPFTENANRVSYVHFRSVGVGGTLYWSHLATDSNETT